MEMSCSHCGGCSGFDFYLHLVVGAGYFSSLASGIHHMSACDSSDIPIIWNCLLKIHPYIPTYKYICLPFRELGPILSTDTGCPNQTGQLAREKS